jgi:hypothetical protein
MRRDGDVSNATERPSVRLILIRKRPARTISSSPSWKPSSIPFTTSCCSRYFAGGGLLRLVQLLALLERGDQVAVLELAVEHALLRVYGGGHLASWLGCVSSLCRRSNLLKVERLLILRVDGRA